MEKFVQHTFFPSGGWAPERIEVNGRKGHQVVCVLGKDNKHYKIFDVDGDSSLERIGEEESDDDDSMRA